MKRGPPIRNGGPPPKRSAPSGPMSRRKCCTLQYLNAGSDVEAITKKKLIVQILISRYNLVSSLFLLQVTRWDTSVSW